MSAGPPLSCALLRLSQKLLELLALRGAHSGPAKTHGTLDAKILPSQYRCTNPASNSWKRTRWSRGGCMISLLMSCIVKFGFTTLCWTRCGGNMLFSCACAATNRNSSQSFRRSQNPFTRLRPEERASQPVSKFAPECGIYWQKAVFAHRGSAPCKQFVSSSKNIISCSLSRS